jgi:hydroxyethylthiazole kinase-like uncharacterized protein yjeF
VKPVLTAEEYKRVDKAWEGDLSAAMDRAGHAVALAAARHGAAYGKRVIVLAGPGNNGGDGYVAARYLKSRGAFVEIRSLGHPKTEVAADAAESAAAAGIPVAGLGSPDPEAGVVIDALFGGGVRGGLPGEVGEWMDTGAPVIAVDYPTGLDPDTGEVEEGAFHAVETVTFGSLKTGHVMGGGPEHCGKVTVADIGIEGGRPAFYIAEESDAPRPVRDRTTHKWDAGAVLVVGGSTGIVGASTYAGRSALVFGAGSVVVASPRADLVHQVAPQLPTFQMADAEARLDRFDVLIAGPGLAEADSDAARPLITKAERVVLDAGGLTPELLASATEGGAEVIVTPHAGEFARLTGYGGGAYAARALARKLGITVLLKGNPTVVTDGGVPVLVTAGGPELASIGTGDVLAGMIGALWARGLGPFHAAVSAAYWHGVAGSDLARRTTVTAELLTTEIGEYAW